MVKEQTTIEQLAIYIDNLLERYQGVQEECDRLRSEVVTLKAENEAKAQEIERLTQEDAAKEREIEAIVNKIESIVG